MAKEKAIDEAPGGGAGRAEGSGSGGEDGPYLPSLSCSDLNDLFDLVRGQILDAMGQKRC
jgi:hypothetical protein